MIIEDTIEKLMKRGASAFSHADGLKTVSCHCLPIFNIACLILMCRGEWCRF